MPPRPPFAPQGQKWCTGQLRKTGDFAVSFFAIQPAIS